METSLFTWKVLVACYLNTDKAKIRLLLFSYFAERHWSEIDIATFSDET